MEQILNSYYENGARKLRKLVNKVVSNKFGGIADKDMDEYYSEANDVFADIIKKERYDSSKGNFEGFLYGALVLAFIDKNKRQNRDKRTTKIEVEFNGGKKKIPVKDIYLDAPIGDDSCSTVGDFIESDFDIDSVLIGEYKSENVEELLSSLSQIQRRIVEMIMKGVTNTEIKNRLNLSENQFKDNMKSIKENRKVFLLKKGDNKRYKKVGGIKMNSEYELSVDDVMDLDTTDSYRTDKYPLGSLLDDFEDDMSPNYIDRTYISQREPFIWKEKQINKFYSRILNNQPIPEIVICERVINGEKISYLIDGLQRLSYAEAFRKNLIPIKSEGAEFVNIKYKKRVDGEDGKTKLIIDTFNIVGKYYRDLPEFLQKRFNNFNIMVTRFFNCTPAMIDYHIRNYNNHVAMNKAQYGITNVSNLTATNIKNISKNHPFFKNNVRATNTNRKDGSWDEVVARTIMAINFIDDWKKEVIDIFTYVNENATDNQFKRLENNLDRLSLVMDDTVKDLLTTTNTYIWLAVYDKFVDLGIDDSKFVEFMKAFKDYLYNKEVDGKCFSEVYRNRSTKDKKIVTGKINGLIKLMMEFLHIDEKDLEEVDTLSFIKETVNPNVTEDDIADYKGDLDILTLYVDNGSKLLDEANQPSLLAIIAYGYKEDKSIDKWFVDYFKNNNTYIRNQKENYLHMKASLDSYCKKGKVA